jgi:hypothetical protein
VKKSFSLFLQDIECSAESNGMYPLLQFSSNMKPYSLSPTFSSEHEYNLTIFGCEKVLSEFLD